MTNDGRKRGRAEDVMVFQEHSLLPRHTQNNHEKKEGRKGSVFDPKKKKLELETKNQKKFALC